MADPANILVRAPTWLGDVVMATPVLRALRSAHPRAQIALEGRPALAELVRGLDSIDAFLPDPGDSWLARAGRLRARRFDWAVLLPDSVRSAAAPWLARIPVRVGYARDPLRRLLLTRALEPPRGPDGQRVPISMLERYLRLTRALGCADPAPLALELPVDPAAAGALGARLAALGAAPDARLLVVTPGASFGSSKLWPVEHFARACDGIARAHDLLPVLAPGPGEEDLARQIAAQWQGGLLLVDPPARIAELVALIDRAKLLLTNDTGPRHVAVARGCPVIVLMGSTDPRHTAHLLERQRVLREPVECSPCHLKVCPIDHRCMTRLAPERALAAARELLA